MIFSRALLSYHTRQLRQSPATGIFLTCGWVAGVLLTFISGQLVATNRAELTGLFTYLPWILAILIPTLAMPVASEGARGVSERLLTLPFTSTQRLFSRFAVYWLLLGIWILGFWPLVATLFYLGSPDFGPIVTGLFGTWLLAAPLLAVSLALSLRAKSGVGGLLASLGACLALVLVGTNTISGWFSAVPGFGWLPSVSHVTLLGAYQPFTVGIFNLSAFILLLGLTFFILGFAIKSNQGRGLFRITSYEIRITTFGAIFLIIALVPAINWLQLDFTADELHTPSPSTISTLRQLTGPVTFTLYLSENNPDVPPAVHQTAHSLTTLLLQLRAAAPSRVNVKISNVDSSTAAAIAALQAGATEQSLPTGTTYFAALTATSDGHTSVIPVLDSTRQPVQEYDVMSLLNRATRTAQPLVTVLSGGNSPQWQRNLSNSFTFNNMSPQGVTEIPSDTNILLLPDDAPLPAPALTAVHNYLNQGGNIILMADSFTRASRTQPGLNEQRFSSILPEFGMTFVSDTVIADPTASTMASQAGAGAMSYPYWLQLTPKNLDTTLPFTTGINKLFWPESGELQLATTTSTTLTLSPVILTGNSARAVPLATFQSTPAELANTNLPPASGAHLLAAMSSGAFGPDVPDEPTRTGNLLVFADSDWASDANLTQNADNLTFLTNVLHYFSGQSMLTQLRAKGASPRTLTRVEDMAARLARATATTEQKVATRLYEVNRNPSDIANAQEEEFTLRQQLRDIRQQTRHRLQMLENALLLLNLALMPTLTGILFLLQRRRQRLKATSTL